MLRLIGCHHFSSRLNGLKIPYTEIPQSPSHWGRRNQDDALERLATTMRRHSIELYMTYFLLENQSFQFTLRVFITRTVQSEWNGIFVFRVCSQNSLCRGCNHMKCSFMQFCLIKRNQTRFQGSRKLTSWRKLSYSLIVACENFRSARAVHTSSLNCIFAFVRER